MSFNLELKLNKPYYAKKITDCQGAYIINIMRVYKFPPTLVLTGINLRKFPDSAKIDQWKINGLRQ